MFIVLVKHDHFFLSEIKLRFGVENMSGLILNAKSPGFHVSNKTTFSCQKTTLDFVLKKCASMPGSFFNTKSTCFQRSVPAESLLGYWVCK